MLIINKTALKKNQQKLSGYHKTALKNKTNRPAKTGCGKIQNEKIVAEERKRNDEQNKKEKKKEKEKTKGPGLWMTGRKTQMPVSIIYNPCLP